MDPSFDNIKDVYQQQLGDQGPVPQLIGRYMADPNGNVHVLADYLGHLSELETDPAAVSRLNTSPYFRVVSRRALLEGEHPDLLPEEELPDGVIRPPSLFDYHHSLLDTPATISFEGGQMNFNGHPLSRPEMERIMANVRAGYAQIRYNQASASVAKMERSIENLMKIEPHLADALTALRQAVSNKQVHPDVLQALSREIFTDPMVRGVGNKKAYADFLSRPKEGVHIRLDGDKFGLINKIHSFEHGNQAITAMGNAIREAADESVGRKNAKTFRPGGDEFHVHVPTVEHAAHFMRNLRSKLEAIPPVGGTHKLSVSAGFGADPDTADRASMMAKQAKNQVGRKPGNEKTSVHSLLPGHEGSIPLDPEQLPLTPPPVSHVDKPGAATSVLLPADLPPVPAAPAASASVKPV